MTRPDILHIHAIGPALVTPIARLLGLTVVVTHHGPDYDRAKWAPFARCVLRLGEWLGMKFANARIAVSQVIVDLIQSKYNLSAVLIPNGVVPRKPSHTFAFVKGLGLEPGKYFLQVSRIVPEKRQLDLIHAYRALHPTTWKLLLVGGITSDKYSRQVQTEAISEQIVLPGFLTGESLHQVYSHAGAFVLPSSHEGLPIALLEALSYGLPVLASDIAANLEVGLETSDYFPLGDLTALSDGLRRISQQRQDQHTRSNRSQTITDKYDWDRIAEMTTNVYAQVTHTSK
jgi:glycosyltransferase involved in cell wall biosynthesis